MSQPDMVSCHINGSWDIILPAHRAARPEWYSESGWEKPRLQALHARVTDIAKTGRCPIVFYVGAEEGEFPALCSMWGAGVVLFEPNPLVWPCIRVVWEANGLEAPLYCYTGFASSKTDEDPSEPECPQGDKDGWPLCAWGPVIHDHQFRSLHDQGHRAPQIRLDDFVDRSGLVPDIICFDVEGAEWEVCRGAESILREIRPTLFASIHPEFMYEQRREYSTDFRYWLRQIGYRETFLEYYHELHIEYSRC